MSATPAVWALVLVGAMGVIELWNLRTCLASLCLTLTRIAEAQESMARDMTAQRMETRERQRPAEDEPPSAWDRAKDIEQRINIRSSPW